MFETEVVMRIRTGALLAVLGVAVLVAGCESEPELPLPESQKPAPEAQAPKQPAQGLAWAAGQAPADACVVLTVAGVADLEKNLKALVGPDGEELDIVQELDEGLPTEGLDPAGPLVFIVPAALDETAPILLVRIKDEAAIKGEKAGAGILATKRSLGPEKGERSGYVLKMGPWAAVADSPTPSRSSCGQRKRLLSPTPSEPPSPSTRSGST